MIVHATTSVVPYERPIVASQTAAQKSVTTDIVRIEN
jgi:hypothetical protein